MTILIAAGVYSQSVPTRVVIVSQPATAAYLPALGDRSVQATCPHCRQTVVTSLHHEVSGFTWLIAGILCFIGYVDKMRHYT